MTQAAGGYTSLNGKLGGEPEFALVLLNEASAYPHGSKQPQTLREGSVILMDVGMPRMNGYDATSRIRQTPWGKEIFIIALTGWGQEEDRKKSRDAGFDDHLVKPVNHDALMKILAEPRTR